MHTISYHMSAADCHVTTTAPPLPNSKSATCVYNRLIDIGPKCVMERKQAGQALTL